MGGSVRVLIVEDDYLVAADLADIFLRAGHEVIGPVATVRDAFHIIDPLPDVATLDFHLRDETSLEIADELARRGVPFVFTTGTPGAVPANHVAAPVCAKPYTDHAILRAVTSVVPD